jgi:hypothetical protein
MENSTQFDLNEAMRQWRENLSASPAFRPADLDELEFHLRDSVALLQTKGLSAREAFWVAKSRVGTNDALDCEFGKVNAEQVWLNRALWMVIGSLAIRTLSSLVSVLVYLAAVAVHELTKEERLLGPFILVVQLVALIGLVLLAWRSARRNNGVVWRMGGWMKAHPIAAAISVFLFVALNYISNGGAIMLMRKTMPSSTFIALLWWQMPIGLLAACFWPIALAWLLVRTARKPVIQ